MSGANEPPGDTDMSFLLPTRAIPTHYTTEHNCGRSQIFRVQKPGRNWDGIKALKLTQPEATAFLAAACAHVREVAAAEGGTAPEWCEFNIAHSLSHGEGRPYKTTHMGWAAYNIAGMFADGNDALIVAEGILQALIARA